MIDEGTDELLAVNLETGSLTVISSDTQGTGPGFNTPREVVLDSAMNRALVVDDGLLAVDLINGDRNVISGAAVGTGTDFSNPTSVALESATTALVTDGNLSVLFSVDLITGNREIVSGGST
ncbi:MAG TPA: hypothetical protein VF268_00375, partial [Gammaproteobacteria bacterium]